MTIALGQFDSLAGYYSYLSLINSQPTISDTRALYTLLRALYLNNGLYDVLNAELGATRISQRDIKPLRNPAFRVVEFYAAKLWPGTLPDALPLTADNEAITEPIEQIWQWSNFGSVKQRMARWFAIYGDLFIKVATRRPADGGVTAVYLQVIEPQCVTDFDTDERGFITYIRLDVPRTRRKADGAIESYTHTEVWDKESQIWRIWQHTQGADTELGRIHVDPTAGTFEESHGNDFIPFVYQQFRDIGHERGDGAYSSQIDKIDEANKLASRLHQMLFRYNKALWALMANANDSSGRPLPPPSVSGLVNTDSQLEMADDTLLELPGTASIESLVPNINYAAALAILQDHMAELKQDLPELAYYEVRGMGTVSGRALRFLLDDAISRLLEARGNGETALIRAQQMALTIGANLGLFRNIGAFEAGDFDHSFAERDVIPADELEIAQTIEAYGRAGVGVQPAAEFIGIAPDQAAKLAASRRLAPQDEVVTRPPIAANGQEPLIQGVNGIQNISRQ